MDFEAIVESLTKEKTALVAAVGSMDEELKAYRQLGTPSEISEAFDKVDEIVASIGAYKEIGTPTEIQEAIDAALTTLAEYSVLGSPMEIRSFITESEYKSNLWKSLGTPAEVNEALTKSTKLIAGYKELGTPEEVNEALTKATKVISEYKELGTPEELGKSLDILEEKTISSKCDQIAAKYNVNSETILSMYGKVSDFSIVEGLLDEGFKGTVTPTISGKPVADKKTVISESVITRLSRVL